MERYGIESAFKLKEAPPAESAEDAFEILSEGAPASLMPVLNEVFSQPDVQLYLGERLQRQRSGQPLLLQLQFRQNGFIDPKESFVG